MVVGVYIVMTSPLHAANGCRCLDPSGVAPHLMRDGR